MGSVKSLDCGDGRVPAWNLRCGDHPIKVVGRQPTSFARSLPTASRRQVAAATAARVMYWGVSDSMIVAVPLMEQTNPAIAVNGVRQSLIAAAGMWLLWLSAGHPIRGGVDVGVGIQIADNEVY